MKKLISMLLLTALMLAVSMTAMAQCGGCRRTANADSQRWCVRMQQRYAQRACFADANSDGVCDNKGQNGCAKFVDADNDGVCDNKGQNGCGQFVDADNDGVCDNMAQGCMKSGNRGCGRRCAK